MQGASRPAKRPRLAATIKVRVACLPCKRGRRKCDLARPCCGCVSRGLEAQCVDSVSTSRASDTASSPRREADTSKPTSESPESDVSNPEPPITFPAWLEMATVKTALQPCASKEVRLPAALLRMFSVFSTSQQYARNLSLHATPKLRATLQKLFSILDEVESRQEQPPPQQQVAVNERPTWESAACGYFTQVQTLGSTGLCVPRKAKACYVNNFWAELSGIHREEIYARICSQDMPSFTTELRLLCCVLITHEKLFRWQVGLTPTADFLRDYVIYSRITKGHSEGRSESVVARNQVRKFLDAEGTPYSQWSTVVLKPEEYNSVIQSPAGPQLCEPLVTEVLGRMTAAELTDPALESKESFASLAKSPAGRATLDRLAAVIERRFGFLLDVVPPATEQSPLPAIAMSPTQMVLAPPHHDDVGMCGISMVADEPGPEPHRFGTTDKLVHLDSPSSKGADAALFNAAAES